MAPGAEWRVGRPRPPASRAPGPAAFAAYAQGHPEPARGDSAQRAGVAGAWRGDLLGQSAADQGTAGRAAGNSANDHRVFASGAARGRAAATAAGSTRGRATAAGGRRTGRETATPQTDSKTQACRQASAQTGPQSRGATTGAATTGRPCRSAGTTCTTGARASDAGFGQCRVPEEPGAGIPVAGSASRLGRHGVVAGACTGQ